MEFQNIDQLKQAFASGQFTFPEEMMVAGIKYKSNKTSDYTLKKMIEDNYKAMWIYFTPFREQAKKLGLEHAIVFLWGFDKNLSMIPWSVRLSTKARLQAPITEMTDNGNSVTVPKERIIGDVVQLQVTSIPGTNTLSAKVDTGASICSLDAQTWDIKGDQVSFISPKLTENRLNMPMVEKMAVKLSNGTVEYRPCIELNVKVNDVQLTNVMFNLNSRETMDYPCLIGQNLLEQAKFLVDPSIDDPTDPDITMEDWEINWEALEEEFNETPRSI